MPLLHESLGIASQGRIISRNNYATLKVPFRKTNMRQKCFIYWSLSLQKIAKLNEKKH